MNRLVRTIATAAAALMLLGTAAAQADGLADAKAALELAQAKLDAANKELEVTTVKKTIADTEKVIADQKLAAALQLLAAAQDRLKAPVYLMEMTEGKVTVIRDQRLQCDAMPFLRYTCEQQDSCAFQVDNEICGFPGGDKDAMELSVAYKCGDQTVRQTFESIPTKKAYLTCK